MPKDADKKTGAFELENTGGLLPGLIAEENEFDRRALLRIGTWGVSAVGAVILAVVSNHWSPGLRHEQVAAGDLARQAQQIQALSRETQTETRRLASAIETLNNDRDRLFSRVTVLEQGLDSVTGALAKQTAPSPSAATPSPQASAVPPSAAWPSAAKPILLPAAPQIVATAAPAPVLGPVTTTAPADKPRAHDAEPVADTAPAVAAPAAAASLMARAMIEAPAPKAVEAAKTAEVKAAAGKAVDAKAAGAKASELKMAEAKATDAPTIRRPEPAPSPVPERAAAASPHASDEAHEAATKVEVQRTDFAVELGSANSLTGLRALWRSARRVNPSLAELDPIIVIKEANNGQGMKLHLAAGPLNDAAAAAKICAAMAEHKRICETTVYDGQRLPLKDEARESKEAKEPRELREPKQPIKLLHEGKQNLAKRRYVKKEEPPPPPPPPAASPSAPPPPEPPKPEPKSPFAALFGHH